MERIEAAYRDQGLVVLALQVRRPPDVFEENVIYWLERIRPAFPVFRLGWDPEWPTRTLPWVVLFDHEGREAFAGKPERAEPAIRKALAAAPDPVLGGPYVKRGELAETIAADRASLGTHLARLRAMKEPDDEIRAMIAAAERWFERRIARIDEHMPGVVEQAEAWDALAKEFAGDVLGDRAATSRDALRAATGFAAEKAADAALRRARVTFRRCPPRGGYFPYHFTRMNYTVIDDPTWIAMRVRMHAELQLELARILESYPDTYAAEEALRLQLAHDIPELTVEAARERVERAERLMKSGRRPAELHEARLLLFEVEEGYLGTDEVWDRAETLHATLRKDRGQELIAAEAEARDLKEAADRLVLEADRAGALLSREKANEIIAKLGDLAKRSGEETALARRILATVKEIEQSFEGTPRMGVGLDPRFRGPGVRILRVYAGTGAEKAGIVPGDVVMKLDGVTLSSLDAFTKAVSSRKAGEVLKAEVKRSSGEVVVLEVLLGRRLRTR